MMKYAEWARTQGHRPATIRTRTKSLEVATHTLDLVNASSMDLADWLATFTGWTRYTYRGALASWYRYLADTEQRPIPPQLPSVEHPDPRPRPITTDELTALLSHAPSHRMRVWLLLGAYAGLRAGEIAATSPRHLHGTSLYLPYTKGGGTTTVILPEWVADELRRCPPWHVAAQTVSSDTAHYMAARGVTPGIHRLRHWHATTMLRQTDNLLLVQQSMRHRSITSTVLYTLVDTDALSAARDALPRVA